MNRRMVRQGDVLLLPIDRVPDEALGECKHSSDSARCVLAHGEVTGHAHAIYPERDAREHVSPVQARVELYELRKPRAFSLLPCDLLRLRECALVRHEEHDPIALAPGDWLRVIQHEGDEAEEMRRVAD